MFGLAGLVGSSWENLTIHNTVHKSGKSSSQQVGASL